jgi:hypothetical protein
MDRPMNLFRFRHAALAAAGALLFLTSAAVAQDSDDEGVLPHHDNSSQNAGQTTPTVVGISAATPGLDQLDATAASLAITSLSGDTQLDTNASPADAMFVASGAYRYAFGQSVTLQGNGQLLLPGGYDVQFQAPASAAAGVALLVVHPDSVELSAVLSGAVAPSFIVPLGALPAADLTVLQGLVESHANALSGLAVSLVYVSIDPQQAVHVSGARLTTDSAPVEVIIH